MASATIKDVPTVVLELTTEEAKYVEKVLRDTNPTTHGFDFGDNGMTDPVWDTLEKVVKL